jgi:hypothetical protein
MIVATIILSQDCSKHLLKTLLVEEQAVPFTIDQYLQKISETAQALREGIAFLSLDNIGRALITKAPTSYVALIFDNKLSEDELIVNWKGATKEIGGLISKMFDPEKDELENKEEVITKIREIAQQYEQEESPISKIREAFW